jgi:hypothetical protein
VTLALPVADADVDVLVVSSSVDDDVDTAVAPDEVVTASPTQFDVERRARSGPKQEIFMRILST